MSDWTMIYCLLFVFLIHRNQATIYRCQTKVSCGCSFVPEVSVSSKIVGGEPAQNYSQGWMASLMYASYPICGASLISPTFAITAAHCVDDYSATYASIKVGTNLLSDINSGTLQTRSIETFFLFILITFHGVTKMILPCCNLQL